MSNHLTLSNLTADGRARERMVRQSDEHDAAALGNEPRPVRQWAMPPTARDFAEAHANADGKPFTGVHYITADQDE